MSINRTNIDQAIADRLATDPGFRSNLLADPRAALAELAGTTIPQNISITVHEESTTDVHLVIAADPTLTESDLELVAGGINWHGNQYCHCS